MNLYLLTQNVNQEYETFDSFVVVAPCPDVAKMLQPALNGRIARIYDPTPAPEGYVNRDEWVSPDRVVVQLVGIADPSLPFGLVVCASFRAG